MAIKRVAMYQTDDGWTFSDEVKARQHQAELDIRKQYHVYDVTLCYNGYYTAMINARSKSEAIEIARKQCDIDEIDLEFNSNETTAEEVEGV